MLCLQPRRSPSRRFMDVDGGKLSRVGSLATNSRLTRKLEAGSEGCQSFHPFSSPDWQITSFAGHEGRLRCWLISHVMLFIVLFDSVQVRLMMMMTMMDFISPNAKHLEAGCPDRRHGPEAGALLVAPSSWSHSCLKERQLNCRAGMRRSARASHPDQSRLR